MSHIYRWLRTIPPMSLQETSVFWSLISRSERGTKSTRALTKSAWVSSSWQFDQFLQPSQLAVLTNLIRRIGYCPHCHMMNSSRDQVFQICDGKTFCLGRQLGEVHRYLGRNIDVFRVFETFINQLFEDLCSYCKER